MIHVKRAYEAAEKTDGDRYLVDRLWPRGIKKEALAIKSWPNMCSQRRATALVPRAPG